jgi:hypothetical protein
LQAGINFNSAAFHINETAEPKLSSREDFNMADMLLPLLITFSCATAPAVNLNAKSIDPISCMKATPGLIIIAGSHAGEDPHGEDPHGADPHDENHDPGTQANADKKAYKAPTDPYGGQAPNTKEPYTQF